MKNNPGRISFLVSRLVIALSAVFSAINILFISLGAPRLMPMALSMTGFLSKTGLSISAERGIPFFAYYSIALSGIVCAVLLLCTLLAGTNRGWLLAGALIVLADCVGAALLILSNGYRSGYWFEIVGHAVLIAAFVTAFISMPRRGKDAVHAAG